LGSRLLNATLLQHLLLLEKHGLLGGETHLLQML